MVLNLYPHFFGLLFLFIIAIRIFCPFSDYIYKTIWTDLNTLSHLIQAFSKNSLGLFSDFRVSCLTSISLSRCAIPMSFCTLQEWGKVFGHHQNFEMNDFLPTQPTFPYINFEYCANLQHQQPSNLTF